MANFTGLTKPELQARLDHLGAKLAEQGRADDVQRLLQDLQVHQIELEMQNRELSEAQDLLEQSRDRYADLYDFAPVGYMSLDDKGLILEVNLTGAALLGMERAHIVDYPFSAFLAAGHVEFFEHLKRALDPERDSATVAVEVTVRTPGGEQREVRLESLVSRRHDHPVCRTALLDITERRRAEEALQRARAELEIRERMEHIKDEFVSTVSHELRTPLTSIIGALGLLVGGAVREGSGQAQAMLDIAYHNSLRLTRLIDDLLDMEKLAAGKMSFEMRVQELMPLVEQAIRDNQAYAERFHVAFALKCSAPGLSVCVDASRMQQVLANFLSNAAKFSPEGATVEVRVSRQGGRARVEVVDRGPGIPAAFRSHVFERFSRADVSDARQRGGTGLGLAISKEIIERMQGTIGFSSEDSRGTCFHFELPAW